MAKIVFQDEGSMGCGRMSGYDSPADVIVAGYFDDPLISAELAGMVNEAELLGIDVDDPEIMGAWLKNLVGKIKSKIKAKKGGQAPALSLSTSAGTANIGPNGVTWQDPANPNAVSAPVGAMDKIKEQLKNPVVLAALIGVPVLFMVMRKKKGKGKKGGKR
jgi:hypothetical protein